MKIMTKPQNLQEGARRRLGLEQGHKRQDGTSSTSRTMVLKQIVLRRRAQGLLGHRAPPPSEGGDVEEIIPTRNSIVHACTTHAANTMHASACNLHALESI